MVFTNATGFHLACLKIALSDIFNGNSQRFKVFIFYEDCRNDKMTTASWIIKVEAICSKFINKCCL